MNLCCTLRHNKPKKQQLKEGIHYNEYKHNIRPLDIVFFRGADGASNFIRYVTRKEYKKEKNNNIVKIDNDAFSHVGLIVTTDILEYINNGKDTTISLEDNKLYIFESTMSGSLTDGVKNIEGKSFLGVQLRLFDDVLKAYNANPNTRVAIGKLTIDVDYNEIKPLFTQLFNKYNGTMYNANFYSLFSALNVCKCLRPKRETVEHVLHTTNWLFCSELVATIYKELGLIPTTVNPENVIPMDFLGFDAESNNLEKVPLIIDTPVYIIY